jgi:hypothetical protein
MPFLLIPTIITFTMTVRTFLIVIGAYKDPVFASFENYGDERIFSPMFSLVAWAISFAYMMLFWYINPGLAFSVGLIIGIPLVAFRDIFEAMVYEHHQAFRIFPLWYHELVINTDREERRRLAYMWLQLPPRTRMIYNTHTVLFLQWVEQVLVTISR